MDIDMCLNLVLFWVSDTRVTTKIVSATPWVHVNNPELITTNRAIITARKHLWLQWMTVPSLAQSEPIMSDAFTNDVLLLLTDKHSQLAIGQNSVHLPFHHSFTLASRKDNISLFCRSLKPGLHYLIKSTKIQVMESRQKC